MREHVESYERAIEYLYGRINYERLQPGGYSAADFKLDRMRRLLSKLGNPQERIPAVHIAGTKGKGSTAVMVAEMLTAAGCRCGLFTSPHLAVFEERIRVDGRMPAPDRLVELVNRMIEPVASMDGMPGRMGPTFFEIATAMAWLHFAEEQADIAVMEVGLGGRLDATNVCSPTVSVITNISRDHTALLGTTLARIAAEKAGIVRREVPVVSGVAGLEARSVIDDVCRRSGAPLHRLGDEIRYSLTIPAGTTAASEDDGLTAGRTIDVQTPGRIWRSVRVPLAGQHQADNAALAVATISLLADRGWPLSPESVKRGMARVKWPGRLEIVRLNSRESLRSRSRSGQGQPTSRPATVIIDAAHNWASMKALLETLETNFPSQRRLLVFAATKDKDVSGMLRQALPRFDTVVLTRYQTNPRGVPMGELCRTMRSITDDPFHVAAEPAAAWKLVTHLAGDGDVICVTGSFFIAAEMRELILEDVRQNDQAAVSPAHQGEPSP